MSVWSALDPYGWDDGGEPVKVAFTGSRHPLVAEQGIALGKELAVVISAVGIEEAHHGGCTGADEFFDALLEALVVPGNRIHVHPASDVSPRWDAGIATRRDRTVHPAAPALVRNGDCLHASDVLLACPATQVEMLRSGTWATIRRATKLGMRVVIIYPDGSVERRDAQPGSRYGERSRGL